MLKYPLCLQCVKINDNRKLLKIVKNIIMQYRTFISYVPMKQIIVLVQLLALNSPHTVFVKQSEQEQDALCPFVA